MNFSPDGGRILALALLLTVNVASLAFPGATQAAPANDNFANATAIGGLNGTRSDSTATATGEPGEPLHAGFPGGHSVWYRWTAPQAGRWFFRTAGSSYDTTLAVYTGSAVNALTEIVSNDDATSGTTSYVQFTATTAGAVYYVAIDGYQGASGSYVLEWQVMLPANNNFASATVIANATGWRADFNAGATAEPGEPHPGNSIWYRWTAPRNMQAAFYTSGSAIDTFLAVYTGTAVGSLTEIASNDNDGELTTSRLSFSATSGTIYRIQITGVAGAGGDTVLRWAEDGVPLPRLLPDISVMASQPLGYLYGWTIDQTEIPGRTLLRVSTTTPNTGTGPLELRGTTTSPLVVQRVFRADGTYDERPAGSFTFHPTHGHLHFDDWVQMHLRAVLPGNGVGDIIASGNKTSFAIIDLEPHNTTLPGAPAASVYEGGLLQGISVGWRDVYSSSLDDQWIDVTAVPPGNYWLEGVVDPEDNIEESNEANNATRILISYAGAAPTNNNFASAAVLTGAAAGATGRTHLATKETGEPNHAGNAGGRSVWYRWTAPASGPVTVSTEGSAFDTLLGVYTGTAVGGLALVAANDDAGSGITTSRLTFTAVAGTIYRLALDGKNGAVGACEIAINPASNDAFAASRPLSGATGSVTGSSRGATVQPGEPAHAGTGGKSVWFSWTAPSAGEASFDTEGSAFDTVLAVYTGTSVDALNPVAEDDNSSLGNTSRVVFTAVAGVTYRLAVDGRDGAAGVHTLTWSVSTRTAPYFLTHPEGANIPLGGTAVFDVVAGGSQPRQYQWWHNEAVVQDGPRISGATTPVLTIAKLQPTDSGSYYVVVTNSLGAAASNIATLIALANPRVIHADDVTGDLGGVLSLPVGIQSQGNENAVRCTVALDPAIFLAPRAVLGPDAAGGTISVDLSQAGRIGLTVTLPPGEVLATGHREIAVIEADVSPSATAGQVLPAFFVNAPVAASVATTAGALLPAQTAAGSITLVKVVPTADLVRQGDGTVRIVLHGVRGRAYSLWKSADLIIWGPVAQGITDGDGFLQAIDPNSAGATQRFYRWKRLP